MSGAPKRRGVSSLSSLRGAVPRVEYQRSHRRFLEAVEPRAAMMGVPHARRALADGETADTLFPERTTVVTTTTVDDETLAELAPEAERSLVAEFGPDHHVPTDFPVYGRMRPERRRQNVVRCAAGTRQMHEALPEVTVLPLLHGTTPAERAITQRVAHEIDAPMGVFYATQHTTAASQFPAIRADLAVLAAETDLPLLVVGYMNPSDYSEARGHSLRNVPGAVRAAAGLNQWVQAVEPRTAEPAAMRRSYRDLERAVADALGVDVDIDAGDSASTTGGERA